MVTTTGERTMIQIVLVDDQTLVRSGIRGLLHLTSDIRVTAEAADGREALDVIVAARPDVVLLDIRMPDRSGIDVLRSLGEGGHCPPTILLTTFDDDAALLEGLRAGARGFLLKDISSDRLADAIRTVAAGSTLYLPSITERLLRGLSDSSRSFPAVDPPEELTIRETEVLRLLTGGFSNREIANVLQMSEGTIKNHVSSILSKLGVRDRVRAVLRGLELGYVCGMSTSSTTGNVN
jgi:DNA-binding NarL/FixJ family response regulator